MTLPDSVDFEDAVDENPEEEYFDEDRDYDVWAETAVSHHEVLKTLEKNVEKTNSIIQNIIPEINKNRDCLCANALDEAI